MFIPFRDHNPSRRIPVVTTCLIIINVAIHLVYASQLEEGRQLATFYYQYGLVPNQVLRHGEFETIFTSMFLHGGWMHLGGNMLFLYLYGDNIEDSLGHFWFLIFYLASGVGAALAQYLSSPGSNIPMIGASGAIAGVMGAYLLLFPKARIDFLLILIVFFRVITLPAWLVLGFWMATQFWGNFNTPSGSGGVAYWAHIGGFVTGAFLVFSYWRKRGGIDFWRKTNFHPTHRESFNEVKTRIPTIRRQR